MPSVLCCSLSLCLVTGFLQLFMSHDCLEVCHAVVLGQVSQVCPGHVFCFLPSGYYLVWFEKEIINLSNEDFVSVYFAAFFK